MQRFTAGVGAASPKTRNAAAGIYGTIICASVLAALSTSESIGAVVVTVLVTVLVYWAAERWSVLLAAGLRGQRLVRGETLRVLAHGWPMVQASYTPLLTVLLAWFAGADIATSVNIGLWVTVVLLLGLGWLAGRRVGLSSWRLVASAAFTGLLGVVLGLLKVATHH